MTTMTICLVLVSCVRALSDPQVMEGRRKQTTSIQNLRVHPIEQSLSVNEWVDPWTIISSVAKDDKGLSQAKTCTLSAVQTDSPSVEGGSRKSSVGWRLTASLKYSSETAWTRLHAAQTAVRWEPGDDNSLEKSARCQFSSETPQGFYFLSLRGLFSIYYYYSTRLFLSSGSLNWFTVTGVRATVRDRQAGGQTDKMGGRMPNSVASLCLCFGMQ